MTWNEEFDGLVAEVGEQLRIALDVYQRAKGMPDLHFTYCFSAFSHLIRWSVRQSLMADWENEASVQADENGTRFESCEERKRKLERAFGAAWCFDCPICGEIDAFICELDDDGRGIVPYRLVHRGHGPCSGEPLADRWLWARRRGALPPGFVLARLCHNLACVRPSHGLLRRWNPTRGLDT